MYDYCTCLLHQLRLAEEVYDGVVGVVNVLLILLLLLRLLGLLLVGVELPLDEVVRQVHWDGLVLVQRIIRVFEPVT